MILLYPYLEERALACRLAAYLPAWVGTREMQRLAGWLRGLVGTRRCKLVDRATWLGSKCGESTILLPAFLPQWQAERQRFHELAHPSSTWAWAPPSTG